MEGDREPGRINTELGIDCKVKEEEKEEDEEEEKGKQERGRRRWSCTGVMESCLLPDFGGREVSAVVR